VRLIVLALIAVAVLAIGGLAWFFFGRGSPDCTQEYCESSIATLDIPADFEQHSKLFERNPDAEPPPDGFDLQVSIPLELPTTDDRGLSIYGYSPGDPTWVPIASVVLDETGDSATGRFADPPQYLAVFRRLNEGRRVVAYLRPGEVLHPTAAALADIVHTLDFTPAFDGSLRGQPTPRPATTAVHYPVISASAAIDGSVPNVDNILATGADRTNHVRQILQRVAAHRLPGIDIAYLDLRADHRTSFTLLISELAEALHAQGKTLTLTLPAPLKAIDRIDEGAYDWAALGQSADLIKIAPIRDQSTYRLHLPEILDHITAAVDPAKVILTITPYASEKSADGVRSLTLTEAMTIASKLAIRSEDMAAGGDIQVVAVNIDRDEGLSGLRWQPETATVAFTYKLNGGRTIWIENLFSAGFKLQFVSVYGLGGLAVEDSSNDVFLGNIWTAVEPFVASGQPVLLQPSQAQLRPRWEVTAGNLVGGDRGLVTWQTPLEAGSYTVTLSLSDGVERFESRIDLYLETLEAEPVEETP
jgi:spore germination protein YaaH